MIEIEVQFVKYTGPLGTGEHRITFDVQPEQAPLLYKALAEWSKTPSGIMYFKPVTKKETDEERRVRYNRKIHQLFDDIAKEKNVESKDVKEKIKKTLITENKIKESLKELNLEDQLDVINRLERIIEDDE